MSEKICNNGKCGKSATHKLVLIIVSNGDTPRGFGATDLFACADCATAGNARYLFDKTCKKRLVSLISKRNGPAPNWQKSYARWEKMSESERFGVIVKVSPLIGNGCR